MAVRVREELRVCPHPELCHPPMLILFGSVGLDRAMHSVICVCALWQRSAHSGADCSHRCRYLMPKLLLVPESRGWPHFQRLMIALLSFLEPYLRNADLTEAIRLLYKVCSYSGVSAWTLHSSL